MFEVVISGDSFTHMKYSFWWHGATGDNVIDLPTAPSYITVRSDILFNLKNVCVFIPHKKNFTF